MRYYNFDLELFGLQAMGDAQQVRVRVSNCPAGQQTADEVNRADPVAIDPELQRQFRQLEARKFTALEELARVGKSLGDILLPGKARRLFFDSLRIAEARDDRLRIRINAPSLANFPWEFVYALPEESSATTEDRAGFLALNQRVSIVRYEQFVGDVRPHDAIAGNIRAVALLASPQDSRYPDLNLDTEEANLRVVFNGIKRLSTDIRSHATVASLSESLRIDTHIFHFAGHGEYDARSEVGSIILKDGADRRATPVVAGTLAVNLCGSRARLAVLGACNSGRRSGENSWNGVASALVRGGIPAVVGMQYTVIDRNAITFSSAFYGSLAEGIPIDYALTRARIAVFTDAENSNAAERDWGVPVLYWRADDRDDAVLFPAPPDGGDSGYTWQELQTISAAQSKRFLSDAEGTETRRGVYRPELYVRRDAVEQKLASFIAESAPGFVLLGESGSGKTNVLCQLAIDAQTHGHAVFMYHCGGLVDANIEQEIMRDLGLTEGNLADAFKHIDHRSRIENKRFILIFEALNDFRGGEKRPAVTLLLRINALVSRLPEDTNVRVVVSCSSAAWNILQRRHQPAIARARFASGPDDDIAGATVATFSVAELTAAYPRYQQSFSLGIQWEDLPARIREQLRAPYLLRIFAESRRGTTGLATQELLERGLVADYYKRRVRRPEDQAFLDQLIAEMYARRESLLPTKDLLRHPVLGVQIREDDEESSWCTLLNEGVLSERDGDAFPGRLTTFTYPSVGSYVLADHCASGGITAATLSDLVASSGKFPLAWEAARLLLTQAPANAESALYGELAQSSNPEQRELVVATLVERHAADPERVKTLIRELIQLDSAEAQRSALKAAYCIGADTREIFVEAAERGDARLREAVKDTLYLIWRNESPAVRRSTTDTLYMVWRRNPGFTVEFMHELLRRSPIHKIARQYMSELFVLLSITIYINHCEKQEVIDQTAQVYRELAEKLRLPGFKRLLGTPGPIMRFLVDVLMAAFGGPIIDVMFPKGLLPEQAFFAVPPAKRTTLKDVAPYLDPAKDLGDAEQLLATMLDSEQQVLSIAAALALAVHLTADFDRAEVAVRKLFETKNPTRRLWILFSFCVLLPDTPAKWGQLALELTRKYLADHPEEFWQRKSSLLAVLDFIFVPIGLAAGKSGEELTLVQELIASARARADRPQIARCIEALAPVGFYYPEPVLAVLRTAIPTDELLQPELWVSVRKLLGTMRTLHLDVVDAFLETLALDDSQRSSVAAAADVDLVHMYLNSFGYFNNAVHFSARYPWMREVLSQGALIRLADAPSRNKFVADYTNAAIGMFFDADFDLIRWTTNARATAGDARG